MGQTNKRIVVIAGVCLLLGGLIYAARYVFWSDSSQPALPGSSFGTGTETPMAVSYAGIGARRGGFANGGAHTVAVLRMGRGGQVWAGSVGEGVAVFEPGLQKWKRFRTSDGLGDECVYAIATDHQGRTWVGHLNHGVSVYNGQTWKNYDATEGPLSQRVFAIAVCPVDGDVWIAGDCGLSRYSVHDDRWSYFTRADGSPSDQASALGFDTDGNLYMGTQCDGVAIASRAGGYSTWRTIPGPTSMPLSSSGKGLPSNLIDDLVVSPDGTVYAATPFGLGIGKDHGQTWTFVRGANWKANVRGLESKPAAIGDNNGAILSEDRCTALALDDAGRLVVGHWHSGVDILDCAKLPDAAARIETVKSPGPVLSVQPLASAGMAVLGSSTQGITIQELSPAQASEPASSVGPVSTPAWPSSAVAPTVQEMDGMIQRVRSWPKSDEAAEYLGDDWGTEGNWIGRVGGDFTELFGVDGGGDVFGDGSEYQINQATGSHISPRDRSSNGYYYDDGDRHDEPCVLYNPKLQRRIFGEWNDGSFALGLYPESWEGPDLGIGVHLPPGVHRVSLYFVNDSKGDDPFRNYVVELKRGESGDFHEVQDSPTLASAHVNSCWNGVYKEFVVRGEGQYWFRIVRDGSHCTKVSAVMIDELDKPSQSPAWPAAYRPPAVADNARNTAPAVAKARELWAAMDQAYDRSGGVGAQRPYRLLAYRAAQAGGADENLLANWRCTLGIWIKNDRRDFDAAMQAKARGQSPPQDQGN